MRALAIRTDPKTARAFVLGSVLAVALASACGAASDPPVEAPGRCGRTSHEPTLVSREGDLARLAGCAVVRGDVIIAGGALTDLDALASLRRVEGSLRIGPTLRLASGAGLRSLRFIGGRFEVAGNTDLAGLYLGELATVGSDVEVTDNLALSILSLHRLERVAGNVEVQDNRDLFRIDLSSLRVVGGAVEISNNAALEMVAVADRVTLSGEGLEVADNPRLPRAALEDLRARFSSRARPPAPSLRTQEGD
jgi:hypothetical protein